MMRVLTIIAMLVALAVIGAGGYWLLAPQPAPALAENYGDWRVGCDEASGRCVLTQRIVDKTNNFQLAQIEIEPGAGEGDALRVLAPLGTWIDPGVALKAGAGDEALTMSFVKCLPAGCLADGALDETFRQALGAAPAATLLLADKRRNVIGVPMSTVGLDDGLVALRAHAAAKTRSARPLARLKDAAGRFLPSSAAQE